jgi:hypothetical protein
VTDGPGGHDASVDEQDGHLPGGHEEVFSRGMRSWNPRRSWWRGQASAPRA